MAKLISRTKRSYKSWLTQPRKRLPRKMQIKSKKFQSRIPTLYPDLDFEFKAWNSASDEALKNFEIGWIRCESL
jgi:hypothetical protein